MFSRVALRDGRVLLYTKRMSSGINAMSVGRIMYAGYSSKLDTWAIETLFGFAVRIRYRFCLIALYIDVGYTNETYVGDTPVPVSDS